MVECMPNISIDKIKNYMFVPIQATYSDGTAQFKASVATALCEMTKFVGPEFSKDKILPILSELIKDESSEVKLKVVQGIYMCSKVVGIDALQGLIQQLETMTKDGQWRVRMTVFELIGDLGISFGKDVFQKHLQKIYLSYLENTAAGVRNMGVEKSVELAK